jgi:hypothetical protein
MRVYYQIPDHPENMQKAVITTPLGIFQFYFMSFSLKNAAQTFHPFMDEILKNLGFCFTCGRYTCLQSFQQERDQHFCTGFWLSPSNRGDTNACHGTLTTWITPTSSRNSPHIWQG